MKEEQETQRAKPAFSARVQLAGLEPGETAPAIAVYEVDAVGKPVRKLARVEKDRLDVQAEWTRLPAIALGPDVTDLAQLTPESLVTFRPDATLPVWRERGLIIGRDIWDRFHFEFVCVSGTARKCRPWWWDIVDRLDLVSGLNLSRNVTLKSLTYRPELHTIIPAHCLPLCDGIVEIYERVCCCFRIRLPDLLDRLREILEVIPIPLPDPPPIDPPGPFPPGPGPDPAPFVTGNLGRLAQRLELAAVHQAVRPQAQMGIRAQTADLRKRLANAPAEVATMPAERLYADYVALTSMSAQQAEQYVLARPYLLGLICTCSMRKVGETPLQPGGRFDFCYLRPRRITLPGVTCHTTFAFKVRQRIQGNWVTVYDGVASHNWFAEGESADIRTWDWRALVCGSGPGDPPPSEGIPFAMVEYIGSPGSRHFNFPAQTGLSRTGALGASSGTFTTSYAPDCPWGGALGIRLWISPEMEPVAKYYRLSVVRVDNSGAPTGAVTVLDAPVAWNRFVFVGGEWKVTSEALSANPADVGGQIGLVRIPYWSSGNYWLSGQYHQVWNTTLFNPGRYLLILELFDASGNRIKPSSAPAGDPGVARNFQFRRWRQGDPNSTDNVPFADVVGVYWIDNSPVQGDIVDIRRNGVPSSEECQFISGPEGTDVSVGFRAYHSRGVSNPNNTFMMSYSLTWRRGLNGPGGAFASGTADVGEPPAAPQASNTLTIGQLLGAWPGFPTTHQRCTFSVYLHVRAKHFTGSARIESYDYHEQASFALEETP
ncbi:hypothetical protein HRbin16_01112 [bacterium HR16]|nr:hypothetical protein HRbin16_01112 [bacterium HR16]